MFNKKGTGALLDTRSPEEQLKDYKFEETVSSYDPVKWVEKKEWKKYPIYNQNGSGSCVAQSLAKMMGIMLGKDSYIHFSATDIYQRRANRPAEGMAGVDAFEIARKGVTLEDLVPSQNMTDVQMDSAEIKDYERKVGDIFKIENYLTVESGNIEKIASIMQKTGKPVMVWFYFKSNEWTDVPEVKDTSATVGNSLRHSVVAVDFTLYKGKKALIIEDSWGTKHGKAGQRIITEDFFKKRNWFSAYAMNFDFDFDENYYKKPTYKFKSEMYFGETSDNVAKLQDRLKTEMLFPVNIQSTGYYGSITAKAVYDFQRENNVGTDYEINLLQGKVVGPKTLEALNNPR